MKMSDLKKFQRNSFFHWSLKHAAVYYIPDETAVNFIWCWLIKESFILV